MRRVYAARESGKANVDSFDFAMRVPLLLTTPIGAFFGLLAGVFLRIQEGVGLWVIVVTTLVGAAASYLLPLAVIQGAGRATSTLYAPSGRSTPRKKEYSLAESYSVRGEYDRAVSALEEAIAEDPDEPEPYLRIARLYRDKLQDSSTAAVWFKRALAEAKLPSGVQLRTRREVIELYVSRMGEPMRAMPLLSRIASEAPESSDGVWAVGELARIRSEVHPGTSEAAEIVDSPVESDLQ